MTTYNDPWAGIRQLQFRKQTIDHPASQGDQEAGGYSTDAWSEAVWGADQDALNAGGYNSKYQLDRPEEVAPNVFRLRLQQPGAHKYDTADAFYAVDPTTGMGTLVEDPTPTREISSREQWRDRLETRILPIAAAVLSAGYGSQALAGVGSGTAGTAAGVNVGLGGGATAADFGMIPAAGGGATYGGIGAAEAAGAAAAGGGAGVGPGLLKLGTLPPVPPPLSPLAMTGASATMPFLDAVPALGAGAGLLSTAAPAAAAAASNGLLSGIDPTLLQLGGAALGAASSQDQEQTTTTKNEPWAPAQPWIKDNIAAGQALQKQYTEQPFSPGQQTAYGNLYGLLNSYNTEMLPGLLGNANAMSQGYDRYAPKETRGKPKFGTVGSTWAPGLLKFGG